uniref:Uncharacterized protein n=1 Tax=viral metagenome TaxID=1070528 RepID=A0A6C0IAJ3_9ZZZZ
MSKESIQNFTIKQHVYLQKMPQNNKQITVILVREITDLILKRYTAATATISSTIPIFIITDTYYPENKIQEYPTLNILYFTDDICSINGYCNSRSIKPVTAWDRCLFFLANYTNLYKYAWILEDDVAIGGPQALKIFFNRYDPVTVDLLGQNMTITVEDVTNAGLVESSLTEFGAAYTPLCRLSRKFIETLHNFVCITKCLYNINILFASLCLTYNLSIQLFAMDLHSHFRSTPLITYEETISNTVSYHLFHPVKDNELWQKIYNTNRFPVRYPEFHNSKNDDEWHAILKLIQYN